MKSDRLARLALALGVAVLVSGAVHAQMLPRGRPFPGQPPFGAGGARPPMMPGSIPGAVSHEPFIDTHVHLDGATPGFSDWEGAAQVALAGMEKLGVTKSLVMPPPFPPTHEHRYDHEAFASTVARHADRLGFLSGGGSLNGTIQEAIAAGTVTERVRRTFVERAEKILHDGALGFGELTAEHLSFNPRHPYVSAPPDHPLFLLLADIAASRDVPIDLHMEAVVHDIPLPPRFASPPNPGTLKENVTGLERLLAHNPNAHIVWVHAGWDNTGHWTPELMRRLLAAHPNLFLSVKIDQLSLPDNRPIGPGGIKPEWLELVRSFPDRFLVGTDSFYASPRFPMQRPARGDAVRAFLDRLPSELARRIGVDNAVGLYHLNSGN